MQTFNLMQPDHTPIMIAYMLLMGYKSPQNKNAHNRKVDVFTPSYKITLAS